MALSRQKYEACSFIEPKGGVNLAIEKMCMVNIHGNVSRLDQTLMRLVDSEIFHPQESLSGQKSDVTAAVGTYTELTKKTLDISRLIGVDLNITDESKLSIKDEDFKDYLDGIYSCISGLNTEKEELSEKISGGNHAKAFIMHLLSAEINLDELSGCEYVHICVGKIPRENVFKLSYYENKSFVYVPLDCDGGYSWGFYFCPMRDREETDGIFASLLFEKVQIPESVHGETGEALKSIEDMLSQAEKRQKDICAKINSLSSEIRDNLDMIYTKLKSYEACETLRGFAVVHGERFVLSGFILEADKEKISEMFKDEGKSVKADFLPADAADTGKIPVKLKNSLFAKPFEMFISMYGMPRYGDIDPTPIIAIFYTLLFGIMFGDVGQGIVLMIGGYLFWKKKQSQLARIIERCGFSSVIFGFVYGSVFGYENLLDPLYRAVGLKSKPLEVMAPESTNILLFGAIGIGAAIILTSMIINIIIGIKRHDIGRAVFSNNGVAGVLLYGYIIAGAALLLLSGKNIFNVWHIVALIVFPAAAIFFKQPISNLISGKKPFEDGVGGFIAENIFELIEVFLTYATNTMSFLRVGGFVLSHAGMMLVVMTLTNMVSATASPIVLVIGNIFVIGMEGLIVGIQVLRLQFYEVFCRFFDGDGEPFNPIKAMK